MNTSAHTRQSGQVILILLLLVAAGLAIGLLAVSRSSVDTQLSTKIERESKAFSANEAVVEDILKTPMTDDTKSTLINDVNVTASKVTIAANTPYEFPISDPIPIGETQTIWLTSHDLASPYAINDTVNSYSGTLINVCWDGPASNTTPPGLVTMLLYKETGVYKVIYGAYVYNALSPASCGTSGQLSDPNNLPNCFTNIAAKSIGNCGITTASTYKQTLTIPSGVIPIFVRVRPVFAPIAKLIARPPGPPPTTTLPAQAITDATVFAQHTVSGESSKIRVFRSYPAPPAIFDYVLFSGLSL